MYNPAKLWALLQTPSCLLRSDCLHGPKSTYFLKICRGLLQPYSPILESLQQRDPEVQPSFPHPFLSILHLFFPCPKRQKKGTNTTSLILASLCAWEPDLWLKYSGPRCCRSKRKIPKGFLGWLLLHELRGFLQSLSMRETGVDPKQA